MAALGGLRAVSSSADVRCSSCVCAGLFTLRVTQAFAMSKSLLTLASLLRLSLLPGPGCFSFPGCSPLGGRVVV
eukprot:14997990-Alexandrium_andersonii.AAC.1